MTKLLVHFIYIFAIFLHPLHYQFECSFSIWLLAIIQEKLRGKCLPGVLDTRSLFSIITNLVIIVIVILITNTIILYKYIIYILQYNYQYKYQYKIPDPFFYTLFIDFLILLQSRFTYVQSSCLLFVVLCTIF